MRIRGKQELGKNWHDKEVMLVACMMGNFGNSNSKIVSDNNDFAANDVNFFSVAYALSCLRSWSFFSHGRTRHMYAIDTSVTMCPMTRQMAQ